MPSEGFLQQFHNLAVPDATVQSKAAAALRRELVKATSGEKGDAEGSSGNLQYAIRRLVRGVQSSRLCARQGFSLALAELLAAFPDELQAILAHAAFKTDLKKDLATSDPKERILGQLFTYVAVQQSGTLKGSKAAGEANKGDKNFRRQQIANYGRGLYEVYQKRAFVRLPALQLMTDVCEDLCNWGLASEVPSLVEAWALDETLVSGGGKATIDVQRAGLLLRLRCMHGDQQQKATNGVASWPQCFKGSSPFGGGDNVDAFVKAMAVEVHACNFGDPLPFSLQPFCRCLMLPEGAKFRAAKACGSMWAALDESLFPERCSMNQQAQGFAALAAMVQEITATAKAQSADGEGVILDDVFVTLFRQLKRGLDYLFKALGWTKAHSHKAAVFAHNCIVQAMGPTGAAPQVKIRRGRTEQPQEEPQGVRMTDAARLEVVSCLHSHAGFKNLANTWQKHYHSALLQPLSAAGVRARLTALLAESAASPAAGPVGCGTQLDQLSVHSRAPDEAILSILCFLFSMAYCGPGKVVEGSSARSRSVREFCKSAGVTITQGEQDVTIPLPEAEMDEKMREQWRNRFWSTLGAVSRRPLPDMAEKIVNDNAGGVSANEASEDEALSSADESTAAANSLMRSTAFHGCLSDGTPIALRVHDWWDFVAGGSTAGPPAKKKRKTADDSGEFVFTRPLSEVDSARRRQCVDSCRQVLEGKEHFGALLKSKQRVALCNLPLSISLAIMSSEDDGEREHFGGLMDELSEALTKLLSTGAPGETPKQRNKAIRSLPKLLQVVPRICAELYVNSTGLIKHAAGAAWRQMGELVPEDTLTSLCASVMDADPDDAESGEADSDEDSNAGKEPNALAASKIAQFKAATEKLKKEREAEAAVAKTAVDQGEDIPEVEEDEEGVITLGGDDMLNELLGEEDDEESRQAKALMASFAGANLEKENNTKLTQRQQKVRVRDEDVKRKLRELDLLEVFLQRFGSKREYSVKLLMELHGAMLTSSRRAEVTAKKHKESEDGKPKKGKGGKTNNTLLELEFTLAHRIAKLLSKCVRHAGKGGAIETISGWHDLESWAEFARSLFAASLKHKAAKSQKHLPVSSSFLFLLCAAHSEVEGGGKWALASEILASTIKEWGTLKDSEQWCQMVLTTFSTRTPALIAKLPWMDLLRKADGVKAHVQKLQVEFFITSVVQGPTGSCAECRKEVSSLAGNFQELCAQWLESTLPGGAHATASSGYRGKLRRDALRGLRGTLRFQKKLGAEDPSSISDELSKRIAKAATAVRTSLPVRAGEIYALCLNVVRSLDPVAAQAAAAQGTPRSNKRFRRRASQSDETATKEEEPTSESRRKRNKRAGGEAASADGASEAAASVPVKRQRVKAKEA